MLTTFSFLRVLSLEMYAVYTCLLGGRLPVLMIHTGLLKACAWDHEVHVNNLDRKWQVTDGCDSYSQLSINSAFLF